MALRTYLTILADSARLYPDRAAFKIPVTSTAINQHRWQTITYSQFSANVGLYARYWSQILAKDNIPRGSVVGLWVGGFEYTDIVHVYGLTHAGYIPQLFPGRLPNPSVIYELMGLAGAKALIHATALGPVTDCLVPTHDARIVDPQDTIHEAFLPPPLDEKSPDDIIIIYHTSGSTGRLPKLVRCTYRWLDCMVSKAASVTVRKDPVRQDVTVWMGSMAHSPQNFMLMGAIQHGACTVQPTNLPYTGSDLMDMIESCQLNRINAYSPLLTSLLRASKDRPALLTALGGLDEVLYSGLALPREQEQWAHANKLNLKNLFGNTECGALLVSVGGSGPDSYLFRPLEGTHYAFVPIDSGEATPHTKLLELVVLSCSGDCPETSHCSKDGNFHTGDLFVEALPGRYAYRGRDDDWIKLANAVRCDTKGMEDEVRAVCKDLLSDCVIVGTGRRCPALFVEPLSDLDKEAAETVKEEIVRRMVNFNSRRYIEERIATPELVFIVAPGSLPRTTTKGNIRRKTVEETYRRDMDKAYDSTAH